MPASYAHYRFGKLLLPTLPADVRQCIQRFRRLYDVGLHGPDFFFYYNPFLSTATGKLGNQVHSQSGQEFFTRACAAASSEAARAYLYGVLAHYCLDSACHPYVNKLDAAGEAGHVALEAEFDRYLMALDGVAQPHRYDVTKFMKLTRGECMTAAALFPPATGGQVRQSLSVMTFCLRFFANGSREKRKALVKKISTTYADLFIPEAPVTAFSRMDSELLARFNRCLRRYPQLLQQLEDCRKNGEPLGEEFAPNFG